MLGSTLTRFSRELSRRVLVMVRKRKRHADSQASGEEQNLPPSNKNELIANDSGSSKPRRVENDTSEDTTSESQIRETDKNMFVGAHVSAAGGIYNAPINARKMAARSFALFLRNNRSWNSKPLDAADAQKFKETCVSLGYAPEMIVPHGIYLTNCASVNDELLAKSRDTIIDEHKRCEMLGLTLFNFHPGSACGETTVSDAIERVTDSINIVHVETSGVVTLIENMCRQGSTLGGSFEELKLIIDGVQDKSRIGVCFDTCHAFAAGYDIRTKEALDATLEEFDRVIGLPYLRAVHLNDSKGELGCHKDRHEKINNGCIGKTGFTAIMNDKRLCNLPMILETPGEDYVDEIKLLYSLVK